MASGSSEERGTYEYQSCVRGHHVYKETWTPSVDEMLSCSRETSNRHDPFAVKVTNPEVVGHLPRRISSICSLFLRKGGMISCKITGSRRYSSDLIQGGLEVPCILLFEGAKSLVEKVMCLLQFSNKVSFNDSLVENPPKKRKLDSNENTVSQWLFMNVANIALTIDDKADIDNGRWLNDKHIDFAQHLLKSAFPSIDGLKCTLLQSRLKFNTEEKFVQVLHSRGDHWILVSNIQTGPGKVYVYDSLYSEVNKYTEEIIATICGGNVEVCCFQDLQKQEGTNDCGLYCIAIATSLLHNKYPLKFDQSLLRQHLIFCFEKFHLCPFP